MNQPPSHNGRLAPAWKITLIYALFGCLWIILSDRFLVYLDLDRSALGLVMTLKGWGFIIVTSGLLFGLIRREMCKTFRSERALRNSQQELAATLNSLGEGVIATDLNGRIRRLNPVAERLTGWPAEGMLTRLGYEVCLAEDGEAAVALYASQHASFDLVLLDIIMPKMNGREAMRAIRAINPAARILICSGYSPGGDLACLLAEGAVSFIAKPFLAAELSRKVAEMLAPETS